MATLKSLVDETTSIKNEIVECRDMLKQILIDKKIEDAKDEIKLPMLIDKVSNFEAIDSNKLWLYDKGQKFVEFVGSYVETLPIGQLEFESNYMYANCPQSKLLNVVTSNTINLSEYRFFMCSVKVVSKNTHQTYTPVIGVSTRQNDSNFPAYTGFVNNEIKTISLDISSMSGNYYIAIHCPEYHVEIHQIWLEK